jgi:hypothetical protein
MPLVITPEVGIPLPINTTPEEIEDFREKARALCETVKELIKNGADVAITPQDEQEAHELFTEQKRLNPKKVTPGAVLKLEALLSSYDHELLNAATRLRTFVTNRLLEESEHEDAKIRIRALELLGKISDVGLFAEKLNVEVKYKRSDDIEAEILKKLDRYIDAEVIEIKENPVLDVDLDAELGLDATDEEDYSPEDDEDDA